MSENKEIEIMQSVYDKNDETASRINASLTEKGIFAVNVMGAPGAGKTTSLIQIIKQLDGINSYVIEGDIEADFDTKNYCLLECRPFRSILVVPAIWIPL